MAKAKKITALHVPPPYTVELTLDQNEAEFLLAVTYLIGGDPATTRRKYADAILRALKEAGVKAYTVLDVLPSCRSIWFN